MNRDDGLGPYIYCKRGLSHCDDQTCHCIDVAKYRAMYQMSRERHGWNLGPYPHRVALWFTFAGLAGALLGLLLLVLRIRLDAQ
jgi:hypothetical protein